MAYWAPKPDSQLVCESEFIVYGSYDARSKPTEVTPPGIHLAYIDVQAILAAPAEHMNINKLALKVPSPGAPVSSDMLFFQQGQQGLWFLSRTQDSAVYFTVRHPAQFKEMAIDGAELNDWKQRLSSFSCKKS
ncbi:hypothetical protein [Photobacterium sanctipauli]|nr:hypothetical protein [Photobacterium sanctipauli]